MKKSLDTLQEWIWLKIFYLVQVTILIDIPIKKNIYIFFLGEFDELGDETCLEVVNPLKV